MKFLFKIILIVIFTLGIKESRANTLFDSLNSAYLKNLKLNAERANMRASREEKRESISEFLPSVTISGYRSEQDNTKGNSDDSSFEPKENSMLIEQKFFLEVIQSRTILLNSRINLAIAERNFFISQFNLLSVVGRLTAKQLNLKQ